jgi:hypothetical protein
MACEAHDLGMDDQPRNCPFCELRFATHNEVKDHIMHDHPEHMAMADIEIHELPR